MAIAPYIPPSALFQDFNLPFVTNDSTNGLWNFDSTEEGGIPFVSGAQLENQQIPQSLNAVAQSKEQHTNEASTPSNLLGASGSGSQIPTHIAKNNPFLNKLRRYVLRWSEVVDGGQTLIADRTSILLFQHGR
jgi:hypothetical protein